MSGQDLTRFEVLFGKPGGSAGYAPGDVTIPVDAPDEQTALVLAGVQLGERMPYGWAAARVVKAIRSEDEAARLAAEPKGVQGVVRGQRPELAEPPDTSRELTAWMTELRNQVNAKRS